MITAKILPSGTIIYNRSEKYASICKEVWHDEKHRLHNEGTPAVVYNNGSYEYMNHGLRHRLDGSAVYWHASRKYSYYVMDAHYSEKEYWQLPEVKQYAYLKEHPELEGFI